MVNISIIICAYNQGKWIERCLRSIYNQKIISNKKYEIILVNDCSKDYTNNIVKKVKKYFKYFNFVQNRKNLGLPNSINLAIKKSIGRYVVRIDSDDYIEPYFLFYLKFFLDNNRHLHAAASDYFRVDKNEIILSRHSAKNEQIACGIMFRKEVLYDLGLYNSKFKMREGHELLERFKKKYDIGYLNLPLYKYRMHNDNRTKKKSVVKKYDKFLRKNKI